jgi:glycerol-3-phosphate dehydrogenase
VLALAGERGELAAPIVAGLPDLLAEVALAARHEQARSIGDVLFRRTRLALLAARELGASPVRRVGEVLARELGWSRERLELELAGYAAEAAAEGASASRESWGEGEGVVQAGRTGSTAARS